MEEVKMNAAEKIREYLGCYNIMSFQPPAKPKPKKVRYGELVRAQLNAKSCNLKERMTKHKQYLMKQAFAGRSVSQLC